MDQVSGAPLTGTGSREPSPDGLGPSGFDPSRIIFRDPTPEELRKTCSRKWARSGPFNIDQWPSDVLALSMATKFIPVTDFDEFWLIFEGDPAVMAKYAAAVDEAVGWSEHFIRMNSRSPKDSAYPGLPITCAGKQAIAWIASSERCADDTSLHQHAEKPYFICARERRPIRPSWEFRCFAKGGEVLAVSRYDYHNRNEIPDEAAMRVFDAAKAFYVRHLSRHYGDVVFDLHAPSTPEELLIELNPYGLSDPCHFRSYEAIENVGGILLRDRDASLDEDANRLSGVTSHSDIKDS